MRTISIAIAIMSILAGVAVAEPPARFADWIEGPVRHLMTADELRLWSSIQSDEEARAFIALFWAKRDPSPATPVNELHDEFDRRVVLADEHFSTTHMTGSMTDRGRTMILLGSPFQVGNRGPAYGAPKNPAYTSVDQWQGEVLGPRGDPALLTWTYSHDKKPKFIKRKDFEILFVDDAGDGQWQFAITSRINPEAILQEAVQAYIFSPGLTKAPVFEGAAATSVRPTAFRALALKDACDQFRAEGRSAVGPAILTWGEFVTPDGEIFVPVQMFIPAGAGIEAGRALTFFGVVENEAGQIVEVHEDEITVAASGRDAYVDKSLLLEPGTYKATFGLADRGRVLTMAKTDMTIRNLDPSESAISQLILSNNAFALPAAQKLTDPFAFGGLKVVPKGDALFSPADEIWYFVEMRNPGVGETGAPMVQAKIDIVGKTGQDKTVKRALPWQNIETLPLKGVKNHYALGMAFPLKDFVPGRYTVKIRVLDTVLQKLYEAEREFQVGM